MLHPQTVDYLEGLLEGFVAYDERWVMTYMNASAERVLGRKREEVLGKTWHEAFPHAVGNPVDQMYQRVMRSRQAERMEYFYPHYGRWLEISASPVRSGGVAVYFRDISDRKRAEEALRASEERLRSIFSAVKVSIWEEDFSAVLSVIEELGAAGVRDWRSHFARHPGLVRELIGRVRILDVNDATLAMFGARDKGELLASLHSIFLPETEAVFAEELVALAEGRAAFESEVALRTLQGERRDVLLTMAFPAKGSRYERVPVALMDISDRKRAEQALRESERHFRTMADTAPAMLWITDPRGMASFLSRGWYEFTGQTEAEALGLGWTQAVHPQDRERSARIFLGANEKREPFALQYRLRRADGEYRWAIDSGRPRFGTAGEFLGYIGSVTDVHEMKLAEQALREADRRKDEFLATLSHELRNPLAPLRNALHLAKLTGEGGAAAQPLHEMMERQVTHLIRLVDDLLELSRITHGTFELRRERVEVAAIVRNALETADPLIKAAGHRVSVSLPDAALWVDGDAVRLAQILANLLNNAARYTPRGGEISVGARREDAAAAVSVRDNGAGIAPAAMARLFEMFHKGERSSGLGIGLALSRRLAEMHGGALEARSDGVGKGAEFTLRLPLAAGERPAAAGAPSPSSAPGRRILVVDDNKDAAETLGTLLKYLGAEVKTAYDGPAALAASEEWRPDVVLLDLGMPGMDGYEVARRLRSRPDGGRIPIVAVTGWGQDEDKKRSREAGFDRHLTKPADLSVIQSILATLP